MAKKTAPKTSYVMDYSSPPTLSWDEYSVEARERWDKILANPSVTEKHIQDFMEENICFMPAPHGALQQGKGSPLSRAVVTQPELPGLQAKIPDFLYFTGDSASITCVLVEIESPTKHWFTKRGQPTAELTQAANQLTQWKAWFSVPANVLTFEKDYHVRDYGLLSNRPFRQHYVLVIGRRSDITSPSTNSGRIHQQPVDQTWMTFDRLVPKPDFEDAVTVKLDRSGPDTKFRALHVPPSLKWGPNHYPDYSELLGLDTAIAANKLMSAGRRAFLAKRKPYWEGWHKTATGIQMINGRDFLGE